MAGTPDFSTEKTRVIVCDEHQDDAGKLLPSALGARGSFVRMTAGRPQAFGEDRTITSDLYKGEVVSYWIEDKSIFLESKREFLPFDADIANLFRGDPKMVARIGDAARRSTMDDDFCDHRDNCSATGIQRIVTSEAVIRHVRNPGCNA